MTPGFSSGNTLNSTPGYVVIRGEGGLADASFSVSASNFTDLTFGKFRLRDSVAVCVPSLANHIVPVIRRRAHKQELRIYAAWIVATMTYDHAFLNRAIVKLIDESVRRRRAIAKFDSSVPIGIERPRPFPTSVWRVLVDLLPEADFRGCAGIVAENKSKRLPLDCSVTLVGIKRNRDWLTATTFAKFNGRVLRGIIEGHSDLHSRCVKSQAVSAALGQLIAYLHYTPFRQSTQGEVIA